MARQDDIESGLQFDPDGRAIPYDTGYISLVFDGTATTAPETFDGLLARNTLATSSRRIRQSAPAGRSCCTGQAVRPGRLSRLLEHLKENGVRVLKDWGTSYDAYSKGEAPMVVSYSTDQVYAHESGEDLAKHQLRFLNDQGYANPEGMAVFEGPDTPDLARESWASFATGNPGRNRRPERPLTATASADLYVRTTPNGRKSRRFQSRSATTNSRAPSRAGSPAGNGSSPRTTTTDCARDFDVGADGADSEKIQRQRLVIRSEAEPPQHYRASGNRRARDRHYRAFASASSTAR